MARNKDYKKYLEKATQDMEKSKKQLEEPNPHIHIMVPIRPLNEDGSWGIKQKKIPVVDPKGNPVLDKNGKQVYRAVPTTDWSTKETLNALRRSWAIRCNELYVAKGLPQRVDERSYEDQGIGMIPTIHEGPAVRAMEAKGMQTLTALSTTALQQLPGIYDTPNLEHRQTEC